jgi:hypothetical protein
MKKIGRPKKYLTEKDRILNRREQNRKNQQKCRLKKKLFLKSKENLNNHKTYKDWLNDFFSQFGFNYFFTGTYNSMYKNDYINFENTKEYRDFINENNIDFDLNNIKCIGINSLRRYSEKYISYLQDKMLIEKSLVFYEYGKENKIHVHMLLKTPNPVINFKLSSEKYWLIGKSKTKHIFDVKNLIDYCIKEIDLDAKGQKSIQQLDNWHFYGDYSDILKNKNLIKPLICS